MVARERLDERVGLALEREQDGVSAALELAHARRRRRRRPGGGGSANVTSTRATRARAQLLDPVDEHEPAVADERDAVGDVLHLGQHVRGEEDRGARPPSPRATSS